ncbi:hypothetical protein [Cellulomonas biazotea]|uniref:Uncharacterized protein n=1 Tax=Cellulomonas biazotea TaxID=1709 RepID=A0A402DSV5_9CELL|nr:hypothetical protein [Cellulomonas biazotea]GCE77202.1 hypothetical protein CBZ_22580 [Cellulomonas biazotea]
MGLFDWLRLDHDLQATTAAGVVLAGGTTADATGGRPDPWVAPDDPIPGDLGFGVAASGFDSGHGIGSGFDGGFGGFDGGGGIDGGGS